MTVTLGIDIGGTGIKGAPVDVELGDLVADRFRIDTPKKSKPHEVGKIVEKIVKHFPDVGGPIGVTFPGVVISGVVCALFSNGVLVPNTELGHIEIDGKDAELLASGSARDNERLPWKDYAKRVQRYLRRLDALVWPDLVILGGGVSKEAEKFLADVKVRVPVVTAELLNNAGIVGAATLAAGR